MYCSLFFIANKIDDHFTLWVEKKNHKLEINLSNRYDIASTSTIQCSSDFKKYHKNINEEYQMEKLLPGSHFFGLTECSIWEAYLQFNVRVIFIF